MGSVGRPRMSSGMLPYLTQNLKSGESLVSGADNVLVHEGSHTVYAAESTPGLRVWGQECGHLLQHMGGSVKGFKLGGGHWDCPACTSSGHSNCHSTDCQVDSVSTPQSCLKPVSSLPAPLCKLLV